MTLDDAYDLLHNIIDTPQEQWKEFYSENSKRALYMLQEDLITNTIVIESYESFCESINKLNKIEAYWSKKFGMVILEANNLLKNGKRDNALSVLNSFIVECNSPSFKELAYIQKDNYSLY